jgi:hypothetical protein
MPPFPQRVRRQRLWLAIWAIMFCFLGVSFAAIGFTWWLWGG